MTMRLVPGLILPPVVFACAGAVAACDWKPRTDELAVVVSIVPQKYFVDLITGASLPVRVMIPTGMDPHMYEPGPERLRDLSDARLYFRLGLEFETATLGRLRGINPDIEAIDLSAQAGALQAGAGHQNPHTWLSPRLVRVQSREMLAALARIAPSRAADFASGQRKLLAEIDRVDRYLRERLAPVRGQLLVVYHPSWLYFAQDYGLEMVAIQADGHEPSARDIMRLIQRAREAGVRTVFAEPGFAQRPVEVIARDIGAEIRLIDPLAADWANNLCAVGDIIAEALQR